MGRLGRLPPGFGPGGLHRTGGGQLHAGVSEPLFGEL